MAVSKLFQKVHGSLNGSQRGEKYHAICPYCNKEPKRGHNHFYYSEKGFYCWTCGENGGLWKLGKKLELDDVGERPAPPSAKEVVKPDEFDMRLVERYCTNPQRLNLWQNYKPLSIDTISKYRLGVGKLPKGNTVQGEFYYHPRLIIPIFQDGKLTALRGRSLAPDVEPKWQTRGPAACFRLDEIRTGGVVIIGENNADSLLMQERYPEWDAISPTHGAQTWMDEWSVAIAAKKPELVIVAYDNDLAGFPHPKLRPILEKEYQEKFFARNPHAKTCTVPPSGGVKVLNSLIRAGVKNPIPFEWPEHAPRHAGLDWIMLDLGAILF